MGAKQDINEKIPDEKTHKKFIIGTIRITKKNSREFIINSYDNMRGKEWKWNWENIDAKSNKKEIENCEIFINDKKINKYFFCYEHTFPEEGDYIIKYFFKKPLTSTCYLFADCKSIISLDLSNFNTKNITNMNSMFWQCFSLVSLNLSNFNTKNVTNMEALFLNCRSLTVLYLVEIKPIINVD